MITVLANALERKCSVSVTHKNVYIILEVTQSLPFSMHILQSFPPLKRGHMLGKIKGKRRREWQRIRWLDNITDSMDMNLSKLWEIVNNREAWHATVHEVARSQTRLSDLTTVDSSRSSPGSRGNGYSSFGYLHL